MFLAGGNIKGGIREEQGTRGFPAVSLLDAEPVLTRRREGGPRYRRGKSKEGEQIRRSGNKVDIQIAVQDR
jgi:hypothetical protein